jgi:hypothetical protein
MGMLASALGFDHVYSGEAQGLVGRQWLFREIDQWRWPLWCTRIPRTNCWQSGTGLPATRERLGSIGDDMNHCGAHVVARCVHVRVFVFLKGDRMLVPSDAQARYK